VLCGVAFIDTIFPDTNTSRSANLASYWLCIIYVGESNENSIFF
jgi:hypothetical protein